MLIVPLRLGPLFNTMYFFLLWKTYHKASVKSIEFLLPSRHAKSSKRQRRQRYYTLGANPLWRAYNAISVQNRKLEAFYCTFGVTYCIRAINYLTNHQSSSRKRNYIASRPLQTAITQAFL